MNYKTFVINLDKDTDRLDFISKQFTDLGMEFERLPAVLGKTYDFSKEYIPELCLEKNGKLMNIGELGCALSHKRVWEKVVFEKLDFALVCEDDIRITVKDFKKILEKNINDNLKNHTWDYLQYDYQKPGIAWMIGWANQVKNTFLANKNFLFRIKHILYSIIKIPAVIAFGLFEGLRNRYYKGVVDFKRDIYFAGCYMITHEGAKTLLGLAETLVYPADRVQNEAKRQLGLKVRYQCPLIVFQQRKQFETNIGRTF